MQFSMLINATARPSKFGHFLTRAWIFLAVLFAGHTLWAGELVVIAHRGASGYLPEHTLASKAMAYAMGADYIEQDVVLTKDDHPIVLHDIHLDTVTDVAAVFPQRVRQDGRYYAIDFTLEEIRRLRVSERFDRKKQTAIYPKRFPLHASGFRVPTLAEEIELIQGLNKSTGRIVGIYPEIKSPAWHRQQGKDISQIVISLLNDYGYQDHDDQVFLQCFDAKELKRISNELKSNLKLVQLIGENDWNEAPTDFEKLRTANGIREIASYAVGIGPWVSHLVAIDDNGHPRITALMQHAREAKLLVHPYTFRADSLPPYAREFDDVLELFVNRVKVDGVFTDFPDLVVRFRRVSRTR